MAILKSSLKPVKSTFKSENKGFNNLKKKNFRENEKNIQRRHLKFKFQG